MLKPGLHPAANHDVTADCGGALRVPRNQGRKSTAVTDAKDKDAVWIDEIIVAEALERCPIAGKLRFEIGLGAIAFAVAYSRFIHPNGDEIRQGR